MERLIRQPGDWIKSLTMSSTLVLFWFFVCKLLMFTWIFIWDCPKRILLKQETWPGMSSCYICRKRNAFFIRLHKRFNICHKGGLKLNKYYSNRELKHRPASWKYCLLYHHQRGFDFAIIQSFYYRENCIIVL